MFSIFAFSVNNLNVARRQMLAINTAFASVSHGSLFLDRKKKFEACYQLKFRKMKTFESGEKMK